MEGPDRTRDNLARQLAEADGKEVWFRAPEAYYRQADEMLNAPESFSGDKRGE